MSHTYDVINIQMKRVFQKQQKMEISRVHGRSGNLPYGQISKKSKSRHSDMKTFRFSALNIVYERILLLFPFFFLFSSHMTRISSQGKSSYRL